MKKNNSKGSSLLITLLVIAAILGIAFGVSKLSLGETKISRDISKSLIAYYAADSGVECQMYNDRLLNETVCGNGGNVYLNAENTIFYKIIASGTYLNGNTGPRIIQSNGTYQDVRRAVELKY